MLLIFIWQTPKQLSKLRCRYRRTQIPIYWSKEEILHYDPWIALYHDVISDREIKIVLNNSITQVNTTNLNLLSWWETDKMEDYEYITWTLLYTQRLQQLKQLRRTQRFRARNHYDVNKNKTREKNYTKLIYISYKLKEIIECFM